MNDDSNLEKVLKEKNREIYIKKLGIDLDKVLESLLMTITNLISLSYIEVVTQLLNLDSGVKNSKNSPVKDLRSFYKGLKQEIEKILSASFKKISTDVLQIENIEYVEILQREKETIINSVVEHYNNNVGNIIKIVLESNKEFTESRVSYFFKEYSYNRFITKVNETLSSSFQIILNSQKESLQKYHSLNDITVTKQVK